MAICDLLVSCCCISLGKVQRAVIGAALGEIVYQKVYGGLDLFGIEKCLIVISFK